MTQDNYKLGKILATSAIISDSAPHSSSGIKWKRIIIALVLGYVCYLGYVAYSSAAWAEMSRKHFNERMDQAEKDAARLCLNLMERINLDLDAVVYTNNPNVNPRTLRLI